MVLKGVFGREMKRNELIAICTCEWQEQRLALQFCSGRENRKEMIVGRSPPKIPRGKSAFKAQKRTDRLSFDPKQPKR